ncbi:50S ribosome-binding GTPase, partial [Rhizoctonia solani]
MLSPKVAEHHQTSVKALSLPPHSCCVLHKAMLIPSQTPLYDELDETNLKTVLVCGASGSGKSRFINTATGSNLVIGHGIDSETDQVIDKGIPLLKYGDNYVQLVDTPGFQDTRDGDEVPVFKNITEWLAARYAGNLRIVGFIYLRSIQESKVLRAETRLIQMFKDLCGEDCLDRVLLVTNRWQQDSDEEEERREREIVTDIRRFGSTGTKHIQVRRLRNKYGTQDAQQIAGLFATRDPVTLQVQREIVDNGVAFNETTAGAHIEADLRVRIEQMAGNNVNPQPNLSYARQQYESLKSKPSAFRVMAGIILTGIAFFAVAVIDSLIF